MEAIMIRVLTAHFVLISIRKMRKTMLLFMNSAKCNTRDQNFRLSALEIIFI